MEDLQPVTYRDFTFEDKEFRVPESGYYFNNTDCWARIDGASARIGVSDFIRLDPRLIVAFEPPDPGLKVSIFDGLCSFTTDRVSLQVNSPVTGTVIAINDELLADPGLVKEDPYERGWVAELKLSDIDDDMEFLMDAQEYFRNARARVAAGPRLGCPCSRRIRVNPGRSREEV